jgi:hypothetical protein
MQAATLSENEQKNLMAASSHDILSLLFVGEKQLVVSSRVRNTEASGKRKEIVIVAVVLVLFW